MVKMLPLRLRLDRLLEITAGRAEARPAFSFQKVSLRLTRGVLQKIFFARLPE